MQLAPVAPVATPPLTNRAEVAVGLVSLPGGLATVMAMNAMSAGMSGKQLTPALVVKGLEPKWGEAADQVVAAARTVAPDLEPKYVAVDQANAGVKALLAQHTADSTTVLDAAATEALFNSYGQHFGAYIDAAKALDPMVKIGEPGLPQA